MIDRDQGPDALNGGAFPTNDSGNADRLLALFGEDLRFAPGIGWLRWDGRRWAPGEGPYHEAELCARLVVEDGKKMGGEVGDALVSWGRQCGNAGRIAACVEVASHRPSVRIEADKLDADPWLFSCSNGTINLRTGALREHRREDLITKMSPVPYTEGAPCSRLLAFLRECMAGDDQLVAYVLRFVGYALTGSVDEQMLGVWYGGGANGKGTLQRLLLHVFGDYAGSIAPELLLAQPGSQHPTGLMDLRGKRLVLSNEAPEGRRWNEALVKQLTGGDRIKARAMRQDFVEFAPTWKLVLACNARPIVREQGRSFWRRVQLLPWSVTFEGREDRELDAKLEAEAEGALALFVAGCQAWLANGKRLSPAPAMLAAVADYQASQDVIGMFAREQLVEAADNFIPRAQVYDAFKRWAENGGEHCVPASVFYRQLEERGWPPTIVRGVRGYRGWRWATTPAIALVAGQK